MNINMFQEPICWARYRGEPFEIDTNKCHSHGRFAKAARFYCHRA